MPKMIMMAYDMPECLNLYQDNYGFSLNEFFKASGEDLNAKFKYEDSVQKWLDLIRGVQIAEIYIVIYLIKKVCLFYLLVTIGW